MTGKPDRNQGKRTRKSIFGATVNMFFAVSLVVSLMPLPGYAAPAGEDAPDSPEAPVAELNLHSADSSASSGDALALNGEGQLIADTGEGGAGNGAGIGYGDPESATWKIQFDLNAPDAGLEPIGDYYIQEDVDLVRVPAAPEREGYAFLGWSTLPAPTLGEAADPDSASDGSGYEAYGLFAPAGALLYNLAYRYVIDENGDIIAVEGDDEYDSEGRLILTSDLEEEAQDGMLVLYAMWEKTAGEGIEEEEAEETDDEDESDGDDLDLPAADSPVAGEDQAVEEEPEEITDSVEAARTKALGSAYSDEAVAAINAEADAAAAAIDKALTIRNEARGGVNLFGLRLGAQDEPSFESNEADGTRIGYMNIYWTTADTAGSAYAPLYNDVGTDVNASRLSLVPSGDVNQAMQFQVDIAISGEDDYEPGTIEFTIPAQIWKDSNGKYIGYLTPSIPEDPDQGQDFAYRLVDGNYIVTNVHRLDPALKASFQFSVRGITPHLVTDAVVPVKNDVYSDAEGPLKDITGKTIAQKTADGYEVVENPSSLTEEELLSGDYYIIDNYVSDAIHPTLTVLTNKGTLIGQEASRSIDATIDTSERITSATKSNSVYEDAPSNLPEALIANLPAGTTKDDYVFVRWQTYIYHAGNQPFELRATDSLVESYVEDRSGNFVLDDDGNKKPIEGFIIGGVDPNGRATFEVSDDGQSVFIDNIYKGYEADTTYLYDHLQYIWSAYPKSQFKQGEVYKFRNTVDWDLNGQVDKVISSKEAESVGIYAPMPFIPPTGHFWMGKYTENVYKDYTYGYALDQLRAGNDVTVNFHLYGRGNIFPYTLPEGATTEDAKDINNYGKRDVHFDLVDDATWFNYDYNHQLTADDFQFDSLRVAKPTQGNYGKLPNGDWAYTGTSANATPDVSVWINQNGTGVPATNVGSAESRIMRDDIDWGTTPYAVVKWDESGNATVTYTADGTVKGGNVVEFPANVTDYRCTFDSHAASVRLDVYPVLRLRSTERIRDIVDELYETMESPFTKLRNDMSLQTSYPDTEEILFTGADSSMATFTNTTLAISSDKSIRYDDRSVAEGGDNDVSKRRVTVHYTCRVHEQTNIESRAQYIAAQDAGIIPRETSGTWYDLLPLGVVPNTASVKLRSGDAIKDVQAVENWRGTGRIMLIVKADLTPTPTTWSGKYGDQPTLTFDAWYGWDSIKDLGPTLVNRVAFQSGVTGTYGTTVVDSEFGNVKQHQGEKDNPTGANGYMNNQTKSAVGEDAELLNDLDPSSDEGRFVYAKSQFNVTGDLSALTELSKRVMDDSKGIWTRGKASDVAQVTVYPGHPYTYRLRVEAAAGTTTKSMIFYDSLEYYKPHGETDMPDTGHQQWRGILRSVDTTELTEMGCAPVVYYSTKPDMDFALIPGETADDAAARVTSGDWVISDTSIWTPASEYTGDMADVTAIAVDARYKADGSEFKLEPQQGTSVFVHMVAPIDEDLLYGGIDASGKDLKDQDGVEEEEGGRFPSKDNPIFAAGDNKYNPANNRYAYNSTCLVCTEMQGDVVLNTNKPIDNPYTRVGILPFEVKVKKFWNDANDNDGKRPDSITLHLMADGEPAELTDGTEVPAIELNGTAEAGTQVGSITYNEDGTWTAKIEHVKAVSDEVNYTPLHYTLREDAPAGYRYSVQEGNRNANGALINVDDNWFTIVNQHEKEQTNISGRKIWEDENDEHGVRPEAITVKLYADGVLRSTKTVGPGVDEKWSYSFGNLDKYKNGKEIVYTVTENDVPKYLGTPVDDELIEAGESPFSLVNTYHPLGNLSVEKAIVDATDEAAKTEFTFKVLLTAEKTDPEADDQPLDGSYTYYLYERSGDGEWIPVYELDGEGNPVMEDVIDPETGEVVTDPDTGDVVQQPKQASGTITSGGEITLKGGQKAEIVDLPSETTYEIVENEADGFTKTASTSTAGIVRAGKTAAASFENTYAADGGVQLKAKKELEGHALARYLFTFRVAEGIVDADTGAVTAGDDLRSAPCQADGSVTFGQISYTQADDGKTYHYVIYEVDTEKPGYTYTDVRYDAAVTVADNGDGTLSTTTVYTQIDPETGLPVEGAESSEEPPAFTNKYEAEGDITLRAWKELPGRTLKEGEFTFQLRDGETGEVLQTKTNVADGSVAFDKIEYSEKDLMEIDPETGAVAYLDKKEYLYTVNEVKGTDPTVIYDESFKGYLVTVIDNNDGTLSISQGNVDVSDRIHRCDECGGTGEVRCPTCMGTGYSTFYYDQGSTNINGQDQAAYPRSAAAGGLCTTCYGLGLVDGQLCGDCMGLGSARLADMVRNNSETCEVIPASEARIYQNSNLGSLAQRAVKQKVEPSSYNNGYYYYILKKSSTCWNCRDEVTHENLGTLVCGHCKGSGVLIDDVDVSETSELPVFTNELEPGKLSITKSVTDGSPAGQLFKFKIKLLGEGLTSDISLDDDDTYVPDPDEPQPPVTIPTNKVVTLSPFHATDDMLQGKAVAVLDAEGTVTLMRISEADYNAKKNYTYYDDIVDIKGNHYTGWLNKGFVHESEGTNYPVTTSTVYNFEDNLDQSSSNNHIDNHVTTAIWNQRKIYGAPSGMPTAKKIVMAEGQAWKPKSMRAWFWGDTSIESIDFSRMDTSGLVAKGGGSITLNNLFYNCSGLKQVTLAFDTSKVRDFGGMFYGCNQLEEVDLSGFNTSQATTYSQMFYGTSSAKLQSVNIGTFNTSGKTVGSMFVGQSNLNRMVLGSNTFLSTGMFSTTSTTWMLDDDPSTQYTLAQLCNTANFQPGTWVLARDTGSYIIKFDANGGGGSMADQTVPINTDARLNANTLYNHGKRFAGWNTEPDGSGTMLANRAAINNLVAGGRIITLYAQWADGLTPTTEENTYEVTLYPGETLTIGNLPAGSAYQVYEETPDGWIIVDQENTSGVIESLETIAAKFTNNYQPLTAQAQLFATKMLDNQPAADGAFSFELRDDAGALLQEKPNGSGGLIAFDALSWTTDDLDDAHKTGDNTWQFNYTISEVVGDDASITYDTSVQNATVTITRTEGGDDADDTLKATVSYDGAAPGAYPVFANTTKPGLLSLSKETVNATPANEDTEFEFTIKLSNPNGMPLDADSVSYYKTPEDATPASGDDSGTALGGESVDDETPVPMEVATKSKTSGNGVALAPLAEGDSASTFHVADLFGGDEVAAEAYMSSTQAFAIVTGENEMIFFRAPKNTYTSGSDKEVEINGAIYTGRLYTGFEEADVASSYYYTKLPAGDRNIKTIRVAEGHAIRPKSMQYWFQSYSGVTSMDLRGIDTSRVTSMYRMLQACTSLESFNASNWDVSSVENMGNVFESCDNLKTESFKIDSWNPVNATTVAAMFQNCKSLVSLTLPNFSAPKATEATYMFMNDYKLTSVQLGNWDMPLVENALGMFMSCQSLVTLDMSAWDAQNLTNTWLMFSDCRALSDLDISGFNTLNATELGLMFSNCSKLARVKLGTDFSFKGLDSNESSKWAILPSHSANATYTANWVREEYDEDGLSPVKLRDSYNAALAGTWVWEKQPTTYRVTLDADGGVVPQEVNTMPKDDEFAMPEPARPGYTFDGWLQTDADGTPLDPEVVLEVGDTVKPAAGAKLYYKAQWSPRTDTKYTVRYLWQDPTDFDTYRVAQSETFEGTTGEEVTPAVKKFEGLKAISEPETVAVEGDSSTVVEYKYDRKRYKVILDSNGGTRDIVELQGIGGLAQQLPACPFHKDDATFVGWNTERDGSGTLYVDQATIKNLAEDGDTVTLYAQWAGVDSAAATEGQFTITLKGGQTATFVDLPAGTTYEIVEVTPPRGWSQTDSDGTTGAIASGSLSAAMFENTYNASGAARLMAHKELVGATPTAGQFEFELTGATMEEPETATNAAVDMAETRSVDDPNSDDPDAVISEPNPFIGTAPVNFSDISYTLEQAKADAEAGKCVYDSEVGSWTYTYKITEKAGSDEIVSYDGAATPVTATVMLVDNGKGRMEAQVSYSGGTEGHKGSVDGNLFVNTLKPGDLSIAKTVAGMGGGTSSVLFDFTVVFTDSEGNSVANHEFDVSGTNEQRSITTDADGSATLKIGDGETALIKGIPNGTKYEVTEAPAKGFTITDRSGETGTIVGNECAEAAFENTYSASGSVVLKARKVFEGREVELGAFTFELRDEGGEVLQAVNNGADLDGDGEISTDAEIAAVVFEPLPFTQSDSGRTLRFTINEHNNGDVTVTYDEHYADVDVTVVDNGDGTLDVTAAYLAPESEADDAAEGAGEGAGEGTGGDAGEGTGGDEGSGEGTGDEGDKPAATVDEVVFVNKLAPAKLSITKTVEGLPEGVEGKTFEFTVTLTDADDGTARSSIELPVAGTSAQESVTTDADGKAVVKVAGGETAVISQIPAKTSYAITEAELAGYTNTEATGAEGTLPANGSAQAVFTNVYSSKGQVALEAVKVLHGAELVADAYSFELYGPDGGLLQTKPNGADLDGNGTIEGDAEIAAVVFDPIAFTQLDHGKTFEYKIVEVAGDDEGIDYDPGKATAAVTVTDQGDGTLKADVAYDGPVTIEQTEPAADAAATVPTFHNYMLVDIPVKKVWDDDDDAYGLRPGSVTVRLLADGEDAGEFAELSEANGWSWTFEGLSKRTAAGTEIAYTVAEDPVEGYDDPVVEGDAAEGFTITNARTPQALRMAFRSVKAAGYAPSAERASAYPEVRKTVNGSAEGLAPGEFSFELHEGPDPTAEGSLVATAANDEFGTVAFFDEDDLGDWGLVYDEPGTWTYSIVEVAGDDPTVTYDDSVITLTVTVAREDPADASSPLAVSLAYADEDGNALAEPTFDNVREGMDLVVYKVSRAGGEGLEGCTYALWMVGSAGSGDVLVQEAVSDADGKIVFADAALVPGRKYYFKEVEAPSGHTVDPYRTAYFSLNEDGDGTVLAEEVAADGWHSKYDNADLDGRSGK